jgi:hypothetical protein
MAKRKEMPQDIGACRAERIPTPAAAPAREKPQPAPNCRKARIRKVPVHKLIPHPLQPPERHSEEGILDLAESIRQHGLLEPPLVRRRSDGTLEILAGHRRVHAWKWLVLQGVVESGMPVLLYTELSDDDATLMIAAEYGHRTDFGALHRARVVGAAVAVRRRELGREPQLRDLGDLVPWKKSQLAKYQAVSDALDDPRTRPLVQSLDNPDIELLYNILRNTEFVRVQAALNCLAAGDIKAARAAIRKPSVAGRPKETVSRNPQGAGYDLTIRYRPTMAPEAAVAALAELADLRERLEVAARGAAGDE